MKSSYTDMGRFVRIVDSALAEDYSLRRLPALAFFRQHTPILYTGDINNQEEVFEFLFQNKHTAEEDVIVEDVDPERLEILINYVDFVVVLFYEVSTVLSEDIFVTNLLSTRYIQYLPISKRFLLSVCCSI
jgi:hypothetical protein